MFLLIQGRAVTSRVINIHLHSTMFLLILAWKEAKNMGETNLHSTMFLLILKQIIDQSLDNEIYIPQCFY